MKLPKEIINIGEIMENAGFEAHLVGGCVRDLVLGIEPKDWDIASNALPEHVQGLFEHSHYDNEYGTVRIVNDDATDEKLKVVEVTTYRQDLGYTDGRRPDNVEFSNKLDDDLDRRDFTINALAYPIHSPVPRETFHEKHIIDNHNGLEDLKKKVITTVGNPDKRFSEDALRLIRAVRFSAQLNFPISHETLISITKNAPLLKKIAVERIADEFNKLLLTNNPAIGLELLQRTNLLNQFIPELEAGIGIDQNQAHSYTVWEHLLRSVQAAADKNFPLDIRISALFHDIGKPETREHSTKTDDWTFYNHEMVGSRVTKSILQRLKYPKKTVSYVTKLVRWHMFFSDPDEITLSAVRRLINNVGKDAIWDLIDLRICDRIGTGRPKEQPYRLRKFQAMIEEAMRDPVTVKMLKINGNDLMEVFHMKPGPKIGHIMQALMEEVLEDPKKNTQEYLKKRSQELLELSQEELSDLAKIARDKIKNVEAKEIKDIRDTYHVK